MFLQGNRRCPHRGDGRNQGEEGHKTRPVLPAASTALTAIPAATSQKPAGAATRWSSALESGRCRPTRRSGAGATASPLRTRIPVVGPAGVAPVLTKLLSASRAPQCFRLHSHGCSGRVGSSAPS